MPVAHFYVTECSPEQQRRLLLEGGRRYAAVFDSPMERVRVFVHRLPPDGVAVGGRVLAEGGEPAPFFTALAMAGRPAGQRHRLLAELTDLLVDVLGVDRSLVRGQVTEVDPDGWGIAGRPASAVRAAEIAARREAGGDPDSGTAVDTGTAS